MIDKIISHLYVSGAGPVLHERGQQEIRDLKIGHVITVSAMAIPLDKRIPNIRYTFVFAMDLAEHDILSSLNEAINHIDTSINDGTNVLVHCEAGMSRSITVVTAYLMKRNKWNLEKALTFVRNIRPIAHPNEGFLEQLRNFELLGYNANRENMNSSQEHRLWRNRTGNSPASNSSGESRSSDVDVSASSSSINENKYRCGKCRQIVFYERHLIKHNRSDNQPCTLSFIIEPMKWMSTSEYQGKVCCPSCNEKLGNYTWGGKQCLGEDGFHCKHLITPWVHLHKSKIDVVKSSQQTMVAPRIPAVVIS
ncbi:unnamed protein product [Auanema sp. JU1783]|nr:unnamed protein product [Auanema sp. JU1783]